MNANPTDTCVNHNSSKLTHLSFSQLAFLSDYLTDLYTGKSRKEFVKNCPQWGLKPGPLDLQANALPTELSQHSVDNLNLHDLCKVMLY